MGNTHSITTLTRQGQAGPWYPQCPRSCRRSSDDESALQWVSNSMSTPTLCVDGQLLSDEGGCAVVTAIAADPALSWHPLQEGKYILEKANILKVGQAYMHSKVLCNGLGCTPTDIVCWDGSLEQQSRCGILYNSRVTVMPHAYANSCSNTPAAVGCSKLRQH